MKDIISKTQHYNHSINRVWSAISEAEHISKWFLYADFKAEKGYNYTFTHETTKIRGIVLAANPVYELTYTWIVGDTTVTTTVYWKLEEVQGGTKLTLEHTGISGYPGETAITMFGNFDRGWENCIKNLDKFLTTL